MTRHHTFFMMAPGFVYACCPADDFTRVKIGFTTKDDPVMYCHEQYSRTLCPLHIIAISSHGNARVAEQIIHTALSLDRVMENHEVFNLSTMRSEMTGLQRLEKAVKYATELNGLSGLPVVQPVDNTAMRQQQRELAQKARDARRSAQRAKAQQARAARVLEKRRQTEEAKREAKREADNAHAEKEQRHKEKLHGFIGQHCTTASKARCPAGVFRQALIRFSGMKRKQKDLRGQMEKLGYRYCTKTGTYKGLTLN